MRVADAPVPDSAGVLHLLTTKRGATSNKQPDTSALQQRVSLQMREAVPPMPLTSSASAALFLGRRDATSGVGAVAAPSTSRAAATSARPAPNRYPPLDSYQRI